VVASGHLDEVQGLLNGGGAGEALLCSVCLLAKAVLSVWLALLFI
jgi:hypothetical protein